MLKAILGEITTEETEGWVYPLWSICWDLAVVIGPALGAFLHNPGKQYPDLWIGQIPLLSRYPYLLPCGVAATLAFLALILVYFCLEEVGVGFYCLIDGGPY